MRALFVQQGSWVRPSAAAQAAQAKRAGLYSTGPPASSLCAPAARGGSFVAMLVWCVVWHVFSLVGGQGAMQCKGVRKLQGCHHATLARSRPDLETADLPDHPCPKRRFSTAVQPTQHREHPTKIRQNVHNPCRLDATAQPAPWGLPLCTVYHLPQPHSFHRLRRSLHTPLLC